MAVALLRENDIDTSYITSNSSKGANRKTKDDDSYQSRKQAPDKSVLGVSGKGIRTGTSVQKTENSAPVQINYNAKQIVERSGVNSNTSLPIGSNAIGKLLGTIDTRYKGQTVKVLLPYGISFKGERRIEKGSTLFGSVQYPGNGNKVYISFSRGITPEGKDFSINAQALNPSNYSPGLVGIHHGNADTRIASTIGLSIVSGMAEVMTEKEALGDAGVVTAKSTLENAAYHGLSKGAEMEANRQMGELANESEYVTVEAHSALIISLTDTFKGLKTL